jgi:hypothetical protein
LYDAPTWLAHSFPVQALKPADERVTAVADPQW